MKRLFFLLFAGWPAFVPATSFAKVTIEPIFGSNMVLQRETPHPVWGSADPGEEITVRFAGQEKSATADASGNWRIILEPLKASAEPQLLTAAGKSGKIELTNVLVGDVWLSGGQSNMAFQLSKARDAEREIAASDVPGVRMCGIHFNVAREPLKQLQGAWRQPEPKLLGRFSAVAYFFARDLHRELNVPIGIIGTAVSGSYATIWISKESQLANAATQEYAEAWDWLDRQIKIVGRSGAKSEYADADGKPLDTKAYNESFKKWKTACAAARKAGQPLPTDFPAAFLVMSNAPLPDSATHRPAGAYNCFIAPLAGYPIKGAIWYQGESHFGTEDYSVSLSLLITDWRKRIGIGDFPFLIVQLPNQGKPAQLPVEGDWALVREQQWQAGQSLPNVWATVNTDTAIADNGDLHPTNKQPIGNRLARLAAAKVYRKNVEASGPVFENLTIDGRTARIAFSNVGGGLFAPPSEVTNLSSAIPKSEVLGFAIAGEDKQWKWAEAKISGDNAVILSAPGIEKPVAVRYNWANYPIGNLFGKSGLPAAPFRTDR